MTPAGKYLTICRLAELNQSLLRMSILQVLVVFNDGEDDVVASGQSMYL